jgi:hypothetical protein
MLLLPQILSTNLRRCFPCLAAIVLTNELRPPISRMTCCSTWIDICAHADTRMPFRKSSLGHPSLPAAVAVVQAWFSPEPTSFNCSLCRSAAGGRPLPIDQWRHNSVARFRSVATTPCAPPSPGPGSTSTILP